jgi:hypothetical protein
MGRWRCTRRRRRRRRRRNATFGWTIRPTISPTLITHVDSPPLPVTTMGRDRKSVSQMGPFSLNGATSRAEVREAVQARGQPIADGHPDVNADYFCR